MWRITVFCVPDLGRESTVVEGSRFRFHIFQEIAERDKKILWIREKGGTLVLLRM
jgi:hypothetical protein